MPARRNIAAYDGGARNAKQFEEPAPHLELPPPVSVPSRFTIMVSGADSVSLTFASRLDGSDGRAIVLDAGTMSPAQPMVRLRSGAAAVVVPAEDAVEPPETAVAFVVVGGAAGVSPPPPPPVPPASATPTPITIAVIAPRPIARRRRTSRRRRACCWRRAARTGSLTQCSGRSR